MTIQVLREMISFELSKKNRERYSIDIADPSSMQDTCHMNFLIDIGVSMAVESPWLSGRASERRIRRSEVPFLMGTQNFFFDPHS